MLRGLYSACAAFAIIFLFSCKSSDEPLQPAAGRLGTLVIAASDATNARLDRLYDSAFTLPDKNGAVPFVELQKPGPEQFIKFFFNQRNVLALVTETDLGEMEELLDVFDEEKLRSMINSPKAEFIVKKDVLALNQQIIYLFGKDAVDIERKFRLCREQLTAALVESELEMQNKDLSVHLKTNDTYYAEMKSNYGIGVRIPDAFRVKAASNGTYFFQLDTTKSGTPKSIGFIVHVYPSKDSSDLSYTSIRSARDSVCKYLVKGPIPGTYMGTSESETYTPAELTPWKIASRDAVKLKGWWTVRGVFMSGPYLRYVIPVPEKKLIFAFEGFIYNGKMDPRERDLRLVESIALNIE